jgi:hypothetical protein
MQTFNFYHKQPMFAIFVVVILLTITVAPLAAQETEEEECAAMIEYALATVGDACNELGRNEACYGNTQIAASGWEDAELEFTQPGDIVNVVDIASLATAPLNMEDNIWGVVLLALQANLPDTMPGQNVTFVLFGDVTLQNEVIPGGDAQSSYNAPMQAFRLTTGIGAARCKDVPRDGILIQAPTETTVNFLINGVEVVVGSTALIRISEDNKSLQIANLAGSVIVKSGDEEVELEVTQQVNAVSDSAPSEPEIYNYDAVRGLPVNLLPERVDIVAPGRNYRIYGCRFADGGDVANAGEDIAVGFGWGDSRDFAYQASRVELTATYDGQPMELWGLIGPTEDFSGQYEEYENFGWINWWWTIPNAQPGQHEIAVSGISNIPPDSVVGVSGEDMTCTITVR